MASDPANASRRTDPDLWLSRRQPTLETCRLFHGIGCQRGCDAADVGAALRAARKTFGMTMGQVARQVDVSVVDLSAYETGERPTPDDVLARLAGLYEWILDPGSAPHVLRGHLRRINDDMSRARVQSAPGTKSIGSPDRKIAPALDRPSLTQIISGGQTGADRGALLAGLEVGLPIGGWIPRGARAEDGRIPDNLAQHMRETSSSSYPPRTSLNVRDADGTMIVSFGSTLGRGSLRTREVAAAMDAPCLHVRVTESGQVAPPLNLDQVVRWLVDHAIQILNVAGPRESREPGLQEATRKFLVQAIEACRGTASPPAGASGESLP